MRFLFRWQHVDPGDRLLGLDGVREAVAVLDGFELPAAAWERSVLPSRVVNYEAAMLDTLCLSGDVAWARLSWRDPERSAPPRFTGATPIALLLREHGAAWHTLRGDTHSLESALSEPSRRVLEVLRSRGAAFFAVLRSACGLDGEAANSAVGGLAAAGLAAADGFAAVRGLVRFSRELPAGRDPRTHVAGRWSALETGTDDAAIEIFAWALLRRYGVVCRRVLAREALAPPWRDLARTLRRLEARGEIRGGRFVSGLSGEHFALPAAVERLREVRRTRPAGAVLVVSGADPLNLAGIVTAGDRIRAAGRSRIAYRDGVPIAVREGDSIRELMPLDASSWIAVRAALRRPARGAPSPHAFPTIHA